MEKRKKILIVTPKFPYPVTGACEQDRAAGMEWFAGEGFEVRVLSKTAMPDAANEAMIVERKFGIKTTLVPYRREPWSLRRILNPLYVDGAAFEYSDPEMKATLRHLLTEFQPDLVWFEYTYLWPLYGMVRRAGIPIVTRSINFEPLHFWEEDGVGVVNALKFLAKFASEIITIWHSDFIFAITPREERIYRRLGGAGKTATLPLRVLPKLLTGSREISTRRPLHVFFMGSTYNVAHNVRAMEFVVKEIASQAMRIAPSEFIFHVLGAKLPPGAAKYFSDNVIYEGYVADLDAFLAGMDIAIAPSFFGAGMQQKIFEPLARGIPTITSERGIAEYPFQNGESVIFASTAREFVEALLRLRDVGFRQKLSQAALAVSNGLFSQEKIGAEINIVINKLLK